MNGTTAPTLDPLAPAAHGIYTDARVVVERLELGTPLDAMRRSDGRVHVRHSIAPGLVDDDLAEPLAETLAAVTDDHATFGSAFTGIVTTSQPDPLRAWERFYRNSLRRIDDPARTGYVEVYRHAVDLLDSEAVLDLGCSFGFLALHLRLLGHRVIAADRDRGAVRLLSRMSRRLMVPLDVVRDTRALSDGAVDDVALVHVLEHLDVDEGDALLGEALRLARRRVVVAVPYEARPTPLYGHVRSIDADDLVRTGERFGRSGWRHRVHDHCGGWLVLDRDSRGPSTRGGRS